MLARVTTVTDEQARCSLEVARNIMADIDRKKSRQLRHGTVGHSMGRRTCPSKTVAEAYSPPRVTKLAREHGLTPMWALDLTEHDPDDGLPWDRHCVKGVWLGVNHRTGEHLIAVDASDQSQPRAD